MHLKDSKEICDQFKSICTEISQRVVYSISQELFHYSKVDKQKDYKKPIMWIFVKVKYFYKRLQTAITLRRHLWNTIAIVIALNSLHENFDTTIASFLETGDKTIDQIQSILQFKKVKNISKQGIIRGASNFAIAFRAKEPKKKANNNNECYNCYKLKNFGRNNFFSNRRLNKTISILREKSCKEGTHVTTKVRYKTIPQTKHNKLQKTTKLPNIRIILVLNLLHQVPSKQSSWATKGYTNLELAILSSLIYVHFIIFAIIKNCSIMMEQKTLTLWWLQNKLSVQKELTSFLSYLEMVIILSYTMLY